MPETKTNNTIQAFWVATGSFCAFGVSLVSTMILSRYFDKTDYGTYRQVLYVYQTLLIVFTLGLPKAYAYFLPRVDERCARSLIKKITRIFYLLGGVFSMLLFLFAPQTAFVLKNPDMEGALRIFSPVPFLLLPTMGLEGIFAVYQKNRYMALYNVLSKSLILLCVALPVMLWKGTYRDALIGFVFASFISFLVANYLKYWCVGSKEKQSTAISYTELFRFSLPLLFASFWGILAQSADKFYISRFFGTDVFAEFSNGSLQLPFVGMIIGACSTVLMPLFSKKAHERCDPRTEILPIWKSVFEKTIKMTYPLVLFFLFFSDYIMVLLYGSQYSNSGTYFAIMLTVNFFTVISYFPVLIAIGASGFYSKVQMYGALAMIVLEYFSILIFDSPYAVTVVSVVCTVGKIGVMLAFIARYFKSGIWEIIPVGLIMKIVFPAVLFLPAIRFALYRLLPTTNLWIIVSLSFLLFLMVYLIWCRIVRIEYKSLVRPVYCKLKKYSIWFM